MRDKDVFRLDAFEPDDRTCSEREDRCQELSVNYEDDEGALAELRSRPNMKAVARVQVSVVEGLVEGSSLAGHERKPLVSNKYHGNILFPDHADTPTWRIRQVQSVLALHAERADG